MKLIDPPGHFENPQQPHGPQNADADGAVWVMNRQYHFKQAPRYHLPIKAASLIMKVHFIRR